MDKIFANVLLIFLACCWPAWVPLWMVLLLLVREFLIQGLRSMAPLKGMVLRTGLVSKLKLVFQMTAAGIVLAGLGWDTAAGVLRPAAWISLALALITGYESMIRLYWKNHDLWRRSAVDMELR